MTEADYYYERHHNWIFKATHLKPLPSIEFTGCKVCRGAGMVAVGPCKNCKGTKKRGVGTCHKCTMNQEPSGYQFEICRACFVDRLPAQPLECSTPEEVTSRHEHFGPFDVTCRYQTQQRARAWIDALQNLREASAIDEMGDAAQPI